MHTYKTINTFIYNAKCIIHYKWILYCNRSINVHSGHGNEDAQYTMGDAVLNTTVKKKDLG